MDGFGGFAALPEADAATVRRAHVRHDAPGAMAELARQVGAGPFAIVVLFVTAEADFAAVMAEAAALFPDTELAGCTTAGEIGMGGYSDGGIVAVALPQDHFAAATLLIEDLGRITADDLVGRMVRARQKLIAARPGWHWEFAFLMVDGLSVREDELVAAITGGLGPVPLFGGSAGDGRRFGRTFVARGARAMENAAVLAFVRTDCPVKVFSLDHLHPTETRMVVTEADPARRIVRQINAEPAAREYARILGKDPEQLSTFTFAAHPVVVRFGGKHHVRAIQRVLENGDLVFFSAIDEGLVLTLAEPEDMVAHLDRELARVAGDGMPAAIIACDCILRRVEADQTQKTRAISSILARNRVVGFSTYGEQVAGMHVNQTMTGVAIFPPSGEG